MGRKAYQLFPAVFLLLIGVFLIGPSGQDDSHITYAAAENLAEGRGLTNINGEWVEQGSSLLHVALLALSEQITGLPMPVTGTLFSLFAALACIPLTFHLAGKIGIAKPLQATWLLVLSAGFTYWAMGGLEATLVALLLLLLTLALHRFLTETGLASRIFLVTTVAAFLLCRPETFFILAAALVALAIFLLPDKNQHRHYPKLFAAALLSITLFLLMAAVRHHFYGQVFPQPVYAKATSLSIGKIGFGFLYFLFSGQLTIILYTLLLAVPVICWLKRRTIPLLLAIVCSIAMAHLAFVITSGGDWMIGGRFFVPVMPLLICIALLHLQDLRFYRISLAALLLLASAETLVLSQTLSTGIPVHAARKYQESLAPQPDWQGYDWTETANYVHIRDIILLNQMEPVVAALTPHHKTLQILTIQMGMIPYHLARKFPGQLYFTDLRGLTTQHVSSCEAFAKAERIWTGIFIQYDDYFAAQKQGACNLPEPDIIFHWLVQDEASNRAKEVSLEENGYRIIYRQEGELVNLSGRNKLKNNMLIAIRQPLYEQLPEHLRNRTLVLTSLSNR